MIWDIIFWIGMAYLAVAVIWRFFVVGLRKSVPTSVAEDVGEKTKRGFGLSSWLAVAAAAAVALAFAVKANPDLLKFGWTPEEEAELAHFFEAVSFYDQATEITTGTERLSPDDWETVSALLQASLSEAEQVSDKVLERLHDGLQSHYRENFLPGLSAGSFGLIEFNRRSLNPKDTAVFVYGDSLDVGRELLDEWNTWYNENREEIEADGK